MSAALDVGCAFGEMVISAISGCPALRETLDAPAHHDTTRHTAPPRARDWRQRR